MIEEKTEVKKGSSRGLLIGAFLLVMAIFAVAGVVSYLSNSVQADISVESPMTLELVGSTNNYITISAFGGETVRLDTIATNIGGAAVDVYPALFTITAPVGHVWSGEEFEAIELTDRSIYIGDILPVLYVVKDDGTRGPLFKDVALSSNFNNKNILRVIVDKDTATTIIENYSHPAGSVIDNSIDIVLADNIAPGAYTVKIEHLYDLAIN